MEQIKTNDILNEINNYELDIIKEILFNNDLLKLFTDKEELNEDLINFLLINSSKSTIYSTVHDFIIFQLIKYYLSNYMMFENNLFEYFESYQSFLKLEHLSNFDFKFLKTLNSVQLSKIIEKYHISFLNSQIVYKNKSFKRIKSKINLQIRGAVYTPDSLAKQITITTINNQIDKGTKKEDLKILDFGCGTGRFYINAFDYLVTNLDLNPHDVIKNNLFGVDIDSTSLDVLKILILDKLTFKSEVDLKYLSENIICKNALLNKKELLFSPEALDSANDFKNADKFNVVISNPPYFLLKINKKDKNNFIQEYYSKIKKDISNELDYFRKSGSYYYSIEGMLNYYKLSIERMINLAGDDAEFGIICPSTLFGDVSSKKLRKWIISEHKLREISYFPESEKFFDKVSQSTVIFYVCKGGKTDNILININNSSFGVKIDTILNIFGNNYEIAYVNEIGWNILNKLSNFKKIKDFDEIRNKRGELDLTLHKKFITNNKTKFNLIRGNMIKQDNIEYNNKEFVKSDKFIENKSEEYIINDFEKKRLVCQQISNIDMFKRLNFVFCNKNDILGNSCNYISISCDEKYLENLKSILNSYLLNWRFKITSSNNHINNYELDQLPLVDFKSCDFDDYDNLKQNIEICKLYGLNKEECIYILNEIYDEEEIVQMWGN